MIDNEVELSLKRVRHPALGAIIHKQVAESAISQSDPGVI